MKELVRLGWTDDFAQYLCEGEELAPARVTAEHRNGYQVQTGNSECLARISGKLRHETASQAERPAVGDWVLVRSPIEGGETTIHRVLPRKSKFSRKVAGQRTEEQVCAANVDIVWIVSSLDQDFSLRRIERYLTLAWESGSSPVIVLTKSDLCGDADHHAAQVEAVAIGTPVHVTSSLTQEGLRELLPYFANHATVALLGSSGVGKSTLINSLAGTSLQETREVRSDGKGRHTTTYRQLLCLPDGGLIIDTPGMRELQLWEGEAGLSEVFGDIDEFANQCRFSDCQHTGEPGCAVEAAVQRGDLPEDRLHSYQKLQRELAHLERKQDARAQLEEKQRVKSIMKSARKSMRHLPKYRK